MTIKADGGERLLAAVRSKDVATVRQALAEGSDPNQPDQDGWTPFHEAVSTGNTSVILAFLGKGGNPDVQDGVNQDSCLHVAAMNGQTKVVQILLDNGANISLKNIEGKTAEQVAVQACKELLQRKRIQLLMSASPDKSTKSFKDGSVLNLCPGRSSSPSKHKESISSQSIDHTEAAGPGQIILSFEYYTKNVSLKVNILEIKDLRLPTVHNFSHLYVKCCLIPDKDKDTKGKTSSFKLDYDDQGYMSRGSSASSQSSTGSYSSIDSDVITGKIMSVLKKRPHLGSKKKQTEVKCVLHSQGDETTGRTSFSIYEALSYDSQILRKLNTLMDELQVYVRVCGRNRWTSKGQTIAEAKIPLAAALKRTQTPLSFYLDYKIDVKVTPEERKLVELNQSLETEGQRTGRSGAWGTAETAESSQLQSMYKAPSVPDFTTKKHKKHKASRFMNENLKKFTGKHNDRYSKKDKKMVDTPSHVLAMENPTCTDEVEYIGSNRLENNMDRLQANSNDNIFQVTGVLDSSPAPQPSLRYSRAFGEQKYGRTPRRKHERDVSIEDVDDDFENEILALS